MNWLSSLNLGFLSPYWLALLPAGLGLLVFAYLRRGKGQQVQVGTAILLKALKRPVFSRKKFRPPLRFYFELLLLGLLIAGGAGLYKQGLGTRIGIIIDNSLSMSRVMKGDVQRSDLLSSALSEASSFIRSLSANSKVDIFVSSPQLTSLSKGFVTADRALEDLKKVEIAYAADNFEAAVAKVAGDSAYEHIVAYTDRRAAEGGSGRVEIRTIAMRSGELTSENVAITHLALREGAAKNSVEVSLAAYLQNQSRVKITLESVTANGKASQSQIVGQKSVLLTGRARDTVEFADLSPAARVFRARIQPDQESLTLNFDSIRGDDTAYLSVEARGAKIALISQFSPADLGLGALRFTEFAHIRPEDFEKNPAEINSRNYSAAIFHRYLPQTLPALNSVFIAPVANTSYLEVGEEVSGFELTRWMTTHPTLNYLNMATLKLVKARVLSVPPWAQELISTTKGAVAFAGEIEQKKYVALGFELLPFEGKKSALTSILALNIIKFLSESGADVGFQAVGGRLHIPPDTAQVFYLDDDASLSASPADFVARRPGFVALSSRLAGTTLAAFNFFDETESDTLTSNRITVTEQKVESSDRKDVNLLSGFIATLVAIVLFLDLLITSGLAGRIKGLRGRA